MKSFAESRSCTSVNCLSHCSSFHCKSVCSILRSWVSTRCLSMLSLLTHFVDQHVKNNFQLLRSKLRRLPPVHQATLKAIVEHLARVASHSEKNKMDAKNLAIVFGTVIFGEDDISKSGDLLSVQTWKVQTQTPSESPFSSNRRLCLQDTLMEDLIVHASKLFQSTASPPLPPAPAGEPVPSISYGTLHTRVTELPPVTAQRTPPPDVRPHDEPAVSGSVPHQASGGEAPPTNSEDFTPQMPARPTNSIHPSLRAGPMPGSTVRQSLPPPPRPAQWSEENLSSYVHASHPPVSHPPSVPSSPSRRGSRHHPPPPLKSPWSDSQPSLHSAAIVPSASMVEPLSVLEGANFISLDEPMSAPSSATTFSSVISPSSSTSSRRAPSTPPLPPKPMTPGSPNESSSHSAFMIASKRMRSTSSASR